MLVWHYLNHTVVRSASVTFVPAEKYSLEGCDPKIARGRDSELSGELPIFSIIDRLIIAIRFHMISNIGLWTGNPRLGIMIQRPSHSIHRPKKPSNHSTTATPHFAKKPLESSTLTKSSPASKKVLATFWSCLRHLETTGSLTCQPTLAMAF
jgi:hypothetical protein